MARVGSAGDGGTSGTAGTSRRMARDASDPSIQGGTVTESGFVLAHKGEMITPALGSDAEVALAQEDTRMTVNINLPVIVELSDPHGVSVMEDTVNETLRRLREALVAQPPIT